MILHNSSRVEYMSHLNPSSANLTKWLNTLKQFAGNLTTNCLSVFEHFVKLTLKGLNWRTEKQESKGTVVMWTTENKQERQHKTWRVSNYDIFWSEWQQNSITNATLRKVMILHARETETIFSYSTLFENKSIRCCAKLPTWTLDSLSQKKEANAWQPRICTSVSLRHKKND